MQRPSRRPAGIIVTGILAALLVLFTAAPLFAAVKPTCSECGMIVDQDSPFSARLVEGGLSRFFCDIGDLVLYLNKKGMRGAGAQVKDHRSGEWIDAARAYYVRSPKKFRTPMGWGIAAFRARQDAEASGTVTEFEALVKEVK